MSVLANSLVGLVLVLGALAPSVALAQDEEPELEFFYPLLTRRPVIEREVEFALQHEKGAEGRRTRVGLALEWPVLPRWQVELTLPAVVRVPDERDPVAGFGDAEVESKVLVWKSVEQRLLVSVGAEATLPTGSERRGLGGEAAIEPFVTGAIALGSFDVVADLAYEWNLESDASGPREQTLSSGVAVAYRGWSRVAPLLELTTASRTRGADEDEGHRLLGRAQLYLTPGLNLRPLPGMTLRVGIQLPLTRARTSDYTIHAGLVREF